MNSIRIIPALACILFAAVSQAQDAVRIDPLHLDSTPTTAPTPKPANPFAKGTWTLQLEGSYTVPIAYSNNENSTGSVGVGYYLFDNNCMTLLARGFHINQEPGHDTDGGELSCMGRSHLYNTRDFSLFIDGGGGYAWAGDDFPTGGTSNNFTARAGAGLAYRLFDNAYLTGGARYFHSSNGGTRTGHDNNPSFNGVEYYIGMIFTFR
jgi:hypothetical protein